LSDDNNRLDRAFGARVLNPPQQPIPLDVLAIGDRSPTGITLAAQRLRDSLSTLKGGGFGAIQRDLLSDAAEQALKNHVPCKLSDIRDALIGVYSDRGKKEDGAISTLRDLSRFVLFEPEFSPAQFFERSWIIRLTADLPDLVKVSIMTLVTDALDRFLNAQNDAPTDDNGNRALRVIAMIDEANRILGSKLPGLSGLIRLSRSKGGSIILISQSPDDFSGVDDEFLDQMGLVVAFRTNADPGAVRRILGANANLAALERGQAWTKMGGEAAARRVLTWR
jgi:DNA sulfur modification protein DndE